MNICADCTEPNTTLHAVIKKDDTLVLYCAHCHSMPRCPDCDDQLSKYHDFECDCGWFDKSRVWVCGHCGDTISNDIKKCGCPNSEDNDDDGDYIDCGVCKRCIDMDKDAFHNIERIAPMHILLGFSGRRYVKQRVDKRPIKKKQGGQNASPPPFFN
jgi:hypothetical protein